MAEISTRTAPAVIRDPRFEAGRSLIQQGLSQEGAIDMFGSLVEECIAKHGESSMETCPAFFEYGNALLRAHLASTGTTEEEADDPKLTPAEDPKVAAANAAEARRKPKSQVKEAEEEDQDLNDQQKEEPAPVASSSEAETAVKVDPDGEDERNEQEEDEDDLPLALEMMENAYSLLDEYQSNNTTSEDDNPINYQQWTKDQLPRVLLGIGDCLAAMERHADAADVFSRALEWRQTRLDDLVASKKEPSVEHLQAQRRVCEATVLIAEELLTCPPDEDVITTETNSLIVKADERIEYARGYYDKARDSLQETVYILGRLASKSVELGTEKEDVCFLATMVMGVGESLAALDEEHAEVGGEPVKKKSKTS